jgi:hypothetical protein
LRAPAKWLATGWGKTTSSSSEPIDVNDVEVGKGALLAALVTWEPIRICQAIGAQAPAAHRVLARAVPCIGPARLSTSVLCLATSGQNFAIQAVIKPPWLCPRIAIFRPETR